MSERTRVQEVVETVVNCFGLSMVGAMTRVENVIVTFSTAPHEVPEAFVARLVGWLEEHPAAAVAAPRLLNLDGSTQATGFRFPGAWQVALDWFPAHPRLLISRLNGRYPRYLDATSFQIDHPLGALMCVRRAAIDVVGGFEALLIRLQLAAPNGRILDANAYNQVFTFLPRPLDGLGIQASYTHTSVQADYTAGARPIKDELIVSVKALEDAEVILVDAA